MAIKAVFIIIGVIIGFMQYGLLRTAAAYMTENKGAGGVVLIKLMIYALIGAVLFMWFKDYAFLCIAGVGAGIIVTAVIDLVRSKKANK
ncbi:MAG: hypothetical protein IKK83_06790 [Clostridia bacterium]|nr:hypothetical protein [Clostridia bacterium]